MTETPRPIVQITRYEISVLPEDDINRHVFTINVEHRGNDRWAVVRHQQCMNAKGEWSWERIPSEREDEWLDEFRFNRMTALELAQWAAPRIVVNGRTALEVWRQNPPQHLGGGANAEDCPACRGTNPDYPFICPGPEGAS